jgi:hypothetical protein
MIGETYQNALIAILQLNADSIVDSLRRENPELAFPENKRRLLMLNKTALENKASFVRVFTDSLLKKQGN